MNNNTTFDEVYDIFMSITKVDKYSLPATDERRYSLINVGRMRYNARKFDNIQQDNLAEQFDRILKDEEKLLLAHFMSLITYENMVSEFASMISVETKDNALKDYKAQLTGRQALVESENQVIKQMLLSTIGDVDYE